MAQTSHELSHSRTLVFCVLAFGPLFHAFSARADLGITRTPLFGNRFLWAAIGGSVVLQLMAVYAPFASAVFGSAPLDASELGLALLIACSVLIPAEVSRLLQRKPSEAHGGA